MAATTATLPLPTLPDEVSIHTQEIFPRQGQVTMKTPPRSHPLTATLLPAVEEYFLEKWPFPSDSARATFKKADLALFTCLCMPSADDDRIELACRANNVLFIMDDIMDNWSLEKARSFYSIFEGLVWGTHGELSSPLETVVSDLFASIRALDTPTSRLGHEFTDGVCAWFRAAVSNTRTSCDTTSLDQYLKYRIIDAGCWLTISLMLWSMQLPVPDAIRELPSVHELEIKALYQGSLVNDVYSYRRELSEAKRLGADKVGGIMVNAVTVVKNEKNMDDGEALAWLEEHIGELEREFEEVAVSVVEQFEGEERKLVGTYAVALREMMVGNWEWSRVCGRYNF
ncbi:terpenoid synthase [Wilcoxina mikolae CBS 423.85]|nr:terpenoid synthase [Wilcoxina mikolae CBS 423.85]